MDVDQFKAINDTLGHDFGDLVLSEVGAFLLRNSRGSDIACRFGGDEFVLILPEISLDTAVAKIESLQAGFERLVLASGSEVPIKVALSMGIASFPEDGATGKELLIVADKALYRAKAGLPGRRLSGLRVETGMAKRTGQLPSKVLPLEALR
jgi:diguanylate cyclase (GGDEF)-like protein